MPDFADRQCKPCEGGVPPLDASDAAASMAGLHAAWQLDDATGRISRTFDFPAFSRTLAFANAVAWIATVEGHHPEMIVTYGRVVVNYRTTAIDGLSENDFICAAKIDRLVAMAGEA